MIEHTGERSSWRVVLSLITIILQSSKLPIAIFSILSLGAVLVPGVLRLSLVEYYPILGGVTLFMGVYISTKLGSLSHRSSFYHLWFSAPIRSSEKLYVALSLNLLYMIAITLGFMLFSIIIRGIGILLTGDILPIIYPLTKEMLPYLGIYILVQPIFLITSMNIRSHPMITGCMLLVAVLCTLALIFLTILGKESLFIGIEQIVQGVLNPKSSSLAERISQGVQPLYWIWGATILATPILLWTSIYYIFVEQENQSREP